MGTHPIFESDFDCLTDSCKMARLPQILSQLFSVFEEHCGSDHKLDKVELRKLLEEEFGVLLKTTMDRNLSDELFKTLDEDRSGSVDFKEFVTLVASFASLC